MPARIVDGDALWRSDKLAQVQPPQYRAEYANMIPLALADGWFECNPRRVWADVYSYNRPDITLEMVEDILKEFERVNLLSRKSDEKGKVWGYWVGIEKRLPCESQRERYKQAKPVVSNDLPVAVADSGVYQDNISARRDLDKSKLGIGREVATATTATSPEEAFSQAKRIYRRYVGKTFGSLGPRGSQWADLVRKHGEDVVTAVGLWAQESGKSLRNVGWPLAVFLKNSEEYLEAVRMQRDDAQKADAERAIEQAAIAQGDAAHAEKEAEIAARRAEEDKIRARVEANPDALFGG